MPARTNTHPRRWSAALQWPLWLLSPLTPRHDFSANPVLGSRLLNRCGLHVARLVAAHALTRLRWWLLAPLLSGAERGAFHRDGFLIVPGVLEPDAFARLRAEIDGLQGEPRQCIQGDTLTQRVLLDETLLTDMPALAGLLRDRRLGGALRYAAAKNSPPFVYVQKIRNAVRDAAPDPQKNLHSDTFHPTMKAWYFLHDVSEAHGPFTYVPGSNRLSLARIRWEYRRSLVAAGLQDGYSEKGSFRFDAADLATLGLPPPRSFAVPANTLVIANTFGIHSRGAAAPGTTRSEIWAYSRFNPFSPWPGLGTALYHRIDRAVVRAWWRHLDRVAARRGQLSSWHPIPSEAFRRE